MRRIFNVKDPFKKILFLGYDESQTKIINALANKNCIVDHTDIQLLKPIHYDLVISFGYRYIINRNTIKSLNCPIFNLHISYLPYNRGAHPNFWSFYDDTPKGVSIHLVDQGIDTGNLLSQRYIKFNHEDDTFEKTYNILISGIENLFLENLDKILYEKWNTFPQKGIGSYHSKNDLPNDFSGWSSNIKEELDRLQSN